jgi:hypothetical protein
MERQIIATGSVRPTSGPQPLSLQLAQRDCILSPSTVWLALRYIGIGIRVQRLLALKRHGAASAALRTAFKP